MPNKVSRGIRFTGIGLVGLALLSITIWVPIKQASGLPKVERVQAETAARDVLIKGLGGSLVFITAFISWENLKATQKSILVAEEKQITERFSKAVEMIGNEHSIHLRLGGIYALERIAKDSERDQRQVIEILAAFVRDRTSSSVDSRPYLFKSLDDLMEEEQEQSQDYYQYLDDPDDNERFARINHTYTRLPTTDIQAAISVIGRRAKLSTESEEDVIDLSQTTLKDIVFSGNYNKVNFYRAHLIKPIFRNGASFYKADFSEAFIENLKAEHSCMEATNFEKSVIIEPTLSHINFRDACFVKAKLSGGTVMNQCNFFRAKLNSLELGGNVPEEPRSKNPNVLSADFEKRSEFKQVNLDEADMICSLLNDAVFELSSFKKTDLEGSIIRGVDFKEADLTEAKLKDVVLIGSVATSRQNSKENIYSLDARYKPYRLKAGVRFQRTNLHGVDMSNAKISNADFETAKHLSANQVREAHGWEEAKYSLPMKEELKLM